jgi:integrase
MIERVRLKRKKPAPPNRKTLTEKNVRMLRPKGKQHLVWDDPKGKYAAYGLAVLVSPRGVKSYRCVYYFPGSPKPHWKHLGRVGEVTLDDAREKTLAARKAARDGDDPRADEAVKSDGFRAVVEDYTRHAQVGERGNHAAGATEAVILSRTKEWHARPVATIRRNEIKELLRRVRDGDGDRRGTPYLANRLHAHLRDFFAWAADDGRLKESPMAGMKKPWSAEGEGRKRGWFSGEAADDMICRVWRAADEIGGDECRYLKLLLLTGKRPWGRDTGCGLGAMRWEHVDDQWFWDAPKSRTKNKRLNGVPLARLAQRIIHPRRREGYVFPEDWTKDHMDKLRSRVRRMTGIDDFILHGLRHVVETKLENLKDAEGRSVAPPHIRDLLHDHAATSGTGKVYSHSEVRDYSRDMASAAEAWAGYVEGLVSPRGVTRLRG